MLLQIDFNHCSSAWRLWQIRLQHLQELNTLEDKVLNHKALILQHKVKTQFSAGIALHLCDIQAATFYQRLGFSGKKSTHLYVTIERMNLRLHSTSSSDWKEKHCIIGWATSHIATTRPSQKVCINNFSVLIVRKCEVEMEFTINQVPIENKWKQISGYFYRSQALLETILKICICSKISRSRNN